MKWAGMYLIGFIVLIGLVIVIGIGIMFSVSNSGTKENIEIDRK